MSSILVTLIIFLSAIGYGSLLPAKNGGGHVLIRLGAGLWLIAHLVFLVGMASLLYQVTLLVILLPGIVFLFLWPPPGLHVGSLFATIRQRLPHSWLEWLILVPTLFLLTLAVSGALTPPTARDSLVYHLALPKLYLEHHQWLEIPHNIFGYFPGLVEALYTMALGLGSHYPALVHAGFGLACLSAAVSLGSTLGLRREICLLSVAALAATPTFWAEMTWAYVDLANAFYWTLTAICFLRWCENKETYWLALLGLCMGAAIGCKYISFVLLPVISLGLLLELRRSGTSAWRQPLFTVTLPVITALVAISPWLSRNLILTGNPLYPFFSDLFPSSSPGWDGERAGLYQIMLTQYGGTDKGLLNYLVAPVRVFLTGRFNSVSHYDGELSFFYLLAFPLLFIRKQWRSKPGKLLGFSLIYLAYWSFSSQQARFLLVILPILAIVGGYFTQFYLADLTGKTVVNHFNTLRVHRLVVIVLLAVILLNGRGILALYAKETYLSYLLGKKSRQMYLSDKLDYYGMYRYINRYLPKDASLLLVKTGNQGYYLNRAYFSDAVFENHTFERILIRSASAAETAGIFRQKGWTHLLIRLEAFLKDHGPSIPAGRLRQFQAFLNGQCRLLKKDGAFWLFEIPDVAADPGEIHHTGVRTPRQKVGMHERPTRKPFAQINKRFLPSYT